jgi:hypothetical protein
MPAKATAPTPDPNAALADELGSLKKEYALLIAPFALKKPRMEALEKQLREACPVAPDAEWTAHGAAFEVILGKCAEWRIVNTQKLIKAIGQKAFNAFASVSLKDLEAHPAVSADTLDAVVAKKRIGPRTLKTVEKGTAA